VPVTGFFEWQEVSKNEKRPNYIHLKDSSIFSLAGIYAVWRNPQEERDYHTFSILTTQANTLMASIHNTKLRMPVILDQPKEKIWLEPSSNHTELQQCFLPFESDLMQAYTVSKLIGSRTHSSNVEAVLKPFHYENLDLFS
jgi:putative SOS response-associated peptidase YedK